MSGSIGGSNRATNAIIKRGEAIAGWSNSLTGKQSSVRHPEQFTIQFDKGTVFLSAVASGDLDEVENLLKEGVDIDYTNVDGLTALHQACIDENEDMVTLLLDEGANIEARDNEGWTPLHAAVSAGNVDIAKILVDEGADLLAVNNEGEVPLDLAEEDEMDEYISEVMDEKAIDPDDARNEEEETMLDDARSWLSKKHIENEPLDWQGATALHVAAAKGYDKVIRTLLQINSVNVNVLDYDGWTPLHAAIHWGAKEVCEQLAEAGASFDIRNNNGQTPCDVADPDFVKFAESLRKQYGKKNASDSGKKLDLNNKPELNIKKLLEREPTVSILKGGKAAKENKPAEPVKPESTVKKEPVKSEVKNESKRTSIHNTANSPRKESSGSSKSSTFKSSINSNNKTTASTVNSSISAMKSINSTTKTNERTSVNTTSRTVNSAVNRPTSTINSTSRTSVTTNSARTTSYNTSISNRKFETPEKKYGTNTASSRLSFDDSKRDVNSSRVQQPTSDSKQANEEYTAISTRSSSLTTTTTSSYVRDDWRKRLARRTEEAKSDNPTNSFQTNETKESEEPPINDSESDQTVKRRVVPRNIRQTRRPTGMVYGQADEDENESNENEPPSSGRHSSTSDSSNTGRMTIADRLRMKNQEILASTDNVNTRTSSYTSSNRDSGYTGSPSTGSYGSRTNRTSTTDTGDTSSLQRKLDQAVKEAEDYKMKYERIKKEKEELEKKLEQYKDDIDKMQELKNDNIRLKDENGALIRVISKLSRTPSSSSS